MLGIQEATKSAIAFAQFALGPDRARDLRLEEAESTTVGGKEVWLITLSLPVPKGDSGELNLLSEMLKTRAREYKSFTVLKDSGEVTSMKIRALADA